MSKVELISLTPDAEKTMAYIARVSNPNNQKWNNYIRKFDVNGIPQVNLFDKKGDLISTFIGKQEEITIKNSMDRLKRESKSYEELINPDFSVIKENKNLEVSPRSHG